MPRGSPPWSQVKLRVSHGDVPPFGCILAMENQKGKLTGRLYQVIGVRGKQLQCLVLPPEALADAEPGTPVWSWRWTPRRPRSAR
jgi:hypothetical protein